MNSFEKRKKIIYEFICDENYIPMKIKEIAIVLQITKEQRPELEAVLSALLEEGKIELSKRGKYSKAAVKKMTGTFIGNRRGYGFVEFEDGDDVFVGEEHVNGALHGDVVEVRLLSQKAGRRKEAKVLRIVERSKAPLVGTFEDCGEYGFVVIDDPRFSEDIYIPSGRTLGAEDRDKVQVEITKYKNNKKKPEGAIIRILGHIDDPHVDIDSIAMAYGLPMEFPKRVLKQAENVAKPVSEADCQGRRDLTDLFTVTIDGEDAKDLDDAITLEKSGEQYLLGVHIADVTNYVQENSALDREALLRGTSVYLADRVIPMLPKELSNGICSLNAGEKRLALSCCMTIDKTGKVVDHEIFESVILVNERMSYTSVKKIIEDQDEAEIERYRDCADRFFLMAELSKLLRRRRHQRGAIDFDFPESKVVLDEDGHPLSIYPYERNTATMLIEDFMLAANETVAEDFFWQESPFVYRIHETPDQDKLRTLNAFVQNFGLRVKLSNEEVHPKELQKLVEQIRDTKEAPIIHRLTLRSMKQAKYSPECVGHFGLAASYYCHFTSPIRRYPDLQIHRIIKDQLHGRMTEKRKEHYQSILSKVAICSSERERRAEEAEWETIKCKKAEYMSAHIGEVYEGTISGVTEWGFYVELPNTVEGLVSMTSLTDDYYFFDQEHFLLCGERTKKTFRLGDSCRVRVIRADKMLRTVDFECADTAAEH